MDLFLISNSNITTNAAALYSDLQTAGWIFTLLVALPENSYVIWLIVTGAGNGVASEFFSFNLSICEIFLCLQSFLALLSRLHINVWLALGFLTGFPVTGRGLFQSLICVERYLAVVHPVTFLKYKPLRYRLICSTAAWIIILISCAFGTFSKNKFQMYMFTLYGLCQALLTLSVQLFCFLAVLRALKQSGPGDRKKQQENHMKRRAFNIIVTILMATFLIYTSYLLIGLSYVLTQDLILTLWTIGHVCFLLGGLVQPLLYLHRTGKLPFCKPP